MEKHLHIKLDSQVKVEAKAYAAKAPMSLGQLVEKALKEYIQRHSEQTEAQRVHDPNKL